MHFGKMFIIQNGLEKNQTFQMKRYTSLLLSQYYEIFISIKERTEEELDKETKKRKVDIEHEVDLVFYEEFIKFTQEAAIEEQILKLTQIR